MLPQCQGLGKGEVMDGRPGQSQTKLAKGFCPRDSEGPCVQDSGVTSANNKLQSVSSEGESLS